MASNFENFWDSEGAVKDYAVKPFLWRGERLAFEAIATEISGHAVLDLACGAGRTTYFLHRMGARVIGVDIAANMIAAARRHFPAIDFRTGDATALEFPDASFDVVLVSFNGLDYLFPKEARLKGLREVWRVLRPNGYLLFSHHNSASLLFGWYKAWRPRMLLYRLGNILKGKAFESECYLPEREARHTAPDLKAYYAWPRKVLEDAAAIGFEPIAVFPSDPVLSMLQNVVRVDALTRLADPWPYHLCRRVQASGPRESGRRA